MGQPVFKCSIFNLNNGVILYNVGNIFGNTIQNNIFFGAIVRFDFTTVESIIIRVYYNYVKHVIKDWICENNSDRNELCAICPRHYLK